MFKKLIIYLQKHKYTNRDRCKDYYYYDPYIKRGEIKSFKCRLNIKWLNKRKFLEMKE